MFYSSIKTKGLSSSISEFLNERKAQNLSQNTVVFYRKRLVEFERWCSQQGVIDTLDLTPEMLRTFLLHLQAKGHNDGGIHSYYRTLKTFLLFYETEYEPDNWKNPIRKVKSPRVVVEPLEGVGTETVHQLISLCDKTTFNGERDRTILQVLLETGVRASELLRLNVEDIDFNDSSILVRMGKGRKPRNVFTGQTVRRQLRRYLRYLPERGALFTTNQGERLKYSGLRQIVRRLCIRAGIPEVGIHDLRRTFALELLRKNVDIQTIARLLGHTSLQVVSRYLKQNKVDLGHSFKSIMDEN